MCSFSGADSGVEGGVLILHPPPPPPPPPPSQPQVCNIVPPRAGHWPPDTAPLTDYTAHTLPHQSVDIFISLQRSCRPWSRAILIPVCRKVSRYQLLSPVYLFVPCMMYTLHTTLWPHTTLASGENMLDSTARGLWTRVCE